MKNGFTLIELLAVIIILAIVALIATPIILDVIEEAQESANLSQAYLLVDGMEQLYANSFIGEDVVLPFTTSDSIYDEIITTGEKPPVGVAYILSDGSTYLKVTIDDTCYLKDYNSNEITKCDGTTTPGEGEEDKEPIEDWVPTVSFIMSNNETWVSENITIPVNSNGYEWKYCVGENKCQANIDGSGEGITLGSNPKNVVCVDVFDNGVKISEMCKTYLIDHESPTIVPSEKSTAMLSQDVVTSRFFTITYGKGSGTTTCNIDSTRKLPLGKHTVSCTVTSNSGHVVSLSREIEVVPLVETDASCFGWNAAAGTLTGYDNDCGADVVIPKQIEGVDVKVIDFYFEIISSLIIQEGVTMIDEKAFGSGKGLINYLFVPSTMTSIGTSAFSGNKITELEFADRVTDKDGNFTPLTIGNSAFTRNSLKKVELPDFVTSIGEHSFEYNQINELTIGTGINTIPVEAFSYNSLTKLVIPPHVTSLGDRAFSHNQLVDVKIDSLTLPMVNDLLAGNPLRKLEIYNANALTTERYSGDTFINAVGSIDTLIIGDGTTHIQTSAFGWDGIKNLIMSDSVVSIGGYAFTGNVLTSVVLSKNLQSIGENAFSQTQMTNIVIPDSVTSIGTRAFYNSSQLSSVTLGSGLTSLPENTFFGTNINTITIPATLISYDSKAFYGATPEVIIYEGRSAPLGTLRGTTATYCDGMVLCN